MKNLAKILALGIIASSIAGAALTTSAEAKGFRGGHGFGHKFGGHRFGGHKFHFGFGHNQCWKFGKWVCGQRGY